MSASNIPIFTKPIPSFDSFNEALDCIHDHSFTHGYGYTLANTKKNDNGYTWAKVTCVYHRKRQRYSDDEISEISDVSNIPDVSNISDAGEDQFIRSLPEECPWSTTICKIPRSQNKWEVRVQDGSHNHPSELPVNFACFRKPSPEMIRDIEGLYDKGLAPAKILSHIHTTYTQTPFRQRDLYNLRQKLQLSKSHGRSPTRQLQHILLIEDKDKWKSEISAFDYGSGSVVEFNE